MKPEFKNEDLYCYVLNVVLPKEEKKDSEYNPFCLSTKCKLGKVDFIFFMPEKIVGFKLDDEQTWPVRRGEFIKVSCVNFERAKNDYEKGRPLPLQGKYNSNFRYEIVKKEEIPQDILEEIYVDRTKQIDIAAKFLLKYTEDESKWTNKNLSKLLKEAIKKYPNFIKAPAAVGHHHAYEGGLLVHSYEVNFLCNSILDACEQLYPGVIDKDVVNISSWLHDIGKTETYYLDEGLNPRIYGEKEDKINHILRGYKIFEMLAEKYDLDSDFVQKVSHCILSHQDRIEWKTPVEPIGMEAIILARADKISSDLAKNE